MSRTAPARIAAAAAALVLAVTTAGSAGAAAVDWGTFDVPGIGSFVVAPHGPVPGPGPRNARIYRVSSSGTVSIFAGTGPGGFDNGYSGDGGPALEAHFAGALGLAWAADGSLLVVDHLNDVLRRIDGRGIVTTIAGSGPLF